MLKPDLTKQVAEEVVGEPTFEFEMVLTADSPIAVAIREYRELFEEVSANGEIIRTDYGHLAEDDALKDDCVYLNILWGRIVNAADMINFQMLFQGDFVEVDALTNVFEEAMLNAVAHGTNFCQDGDVKLMAKGTGTSIMTVVSQPCPGLTPEAVEEKAQSDQLVNINQFGEERGHGFDNFRAQNGPDVWFGFYSEDRPKYEVVILETTDRVWSQSRVEE